MIACMYNPLCLHALVLHTTEIPDHMCKIISVSSAQGMLVNVYNHMHGVYNRLAK